MKRTPLVVAIVISALSYFCFAQANSDSDKFPLLKKVAARIVTAQIPAPLVTQRPAAEVQIAIKAARLIDGRGGPPLEPGMVRIEGERIVEVGTRLTIPKNVEVLDLGNATLLPGLIDLHTHLTDRYGTNWEEALVMARMQRSWLYE